MNMKTIELDEVNALSEDLIRESYLASDRHTGHWVLGWDEFGS